MAALTVNSLYNRVVAQAYTPSDYTSTLFLEDLNIITQDFWSEVVSLQKAQRNWDIWTADTVTLQDEYTKPPITSTSVGAESIENIAIAYQSDTYTETGNLQYTPARIATDSERSNWEFCLENQSNLDPIYFERDGSIFIAPEPRTSEVGTNRLQIKGIKSIASGSWTTATTETETKLPLYVLEVLTLGCIWKAHAYLRRDRNAILDSKAEYTKEKMDAIRKMYTEVPFLNEYPA